MWAHKCGINAGWINLKFILRLLTLKHLFFGSNPFKRAQTLGVELAPNRDSFLGWFSPFPDRFWLFSISPGIHTPFSTAWYCDPAIKSLPLENLHFLTDVTTITTAISTAKYRAEFLCLRYYFMRTVGADEFVTICGVCAGLLLTSNSSFFFLFLGDFFSPPFLKIVFATLNHTSCLC